MVARMNEGPAGKIECLTGAATPAGQRSPEDTEKPGDRPEILPLEDEAAHDLGAAPRVMGRVMGVDMIRVPESVWSLEERER